MIIPFPLAPLLGTILIALGSILACYGVWIFNIRKDPITANIVWSISNPLLCIWYAGYFLQLWDGLLPMALLALMAGYYTAASWWGLWKGSNWWNRFLVWIGAEICEHCASADVQQCGYEEKGHRHYCNRCKKWTYIS